jgi:hypothetical protein
MEETTEQMIQRLLAGMRVDHEAMMAQIRTGQEEIMVQIASLESLLDSYEAKIEANLEVLKIMIRPGQRPSQELRETKTNPDL